MRWIGLCAFVLATTLGACKPKPAETPPATPVVGLDQGWSAANRKAWYEGTQGSRLLPLAWANALETAEGETRFFSPQHMATFGYLPPEADATRPLPVGFVADDHDDAQLGRTKLRWFEGQGTRELWLGMTCAACHTAEITYAGKTLRIDGGPALADYQLFIEQFVAALHATRDDAAKWGRFAIGVLGANDTEANRALLKSAFDKVVAWEDRSLAMNRTDLRSGFGRLDAVGHILNRVAQMTDARNAGQPADAPVSYPFIWNTSQSDLIEWNGMTQNKPLQGPGGVFDYGALGRNVGEVTGVFADVVLTPRAGLAGYRSSAQIANLESLEQLLATLRPPAWPADVLGPIDATLAGEGKTLFGAQCATCHQGLDRRDITTRFSAKMALFNSSDPQNAPPGTDIWMACNAYTATALSGVLQGTARREENNRTPLKSQEPTVNLLGATVTGAILGKKGELAEAALTTWLGVDRPPRVVSASAPEARLSEREQRRQRCMTEKHKSLGYKARPLTGIWATAPYLHNGSVPTLYDLLLPEAQRTRVFAVGGREYDPVKVGYRADQAEARSFLFRTHAGETPIDGNSNAGHDYGSAALTDRQRRALVEYMKTL